MEKLKRIFSVISKKNEAPTPEQVKSLMPLLRKHGIEAFWLYNYESSIEANNMAQDIEIFRRQSILFLFYQSESKKIAAIFDRQGVPYFLFKGLEIASKYYPNPSLRALSDIDILIPQMEFNKGIEHLVANGYQVIDKKGNIVKELEFPLKLGKQIEISLKSPLGVDVDLHRFVYPEFTQINVSNSLFFDPVEDTIFKDALIMLIHHGAREGWLRIKHIIDWYYFLEKNTNYNWNSKLSKIKEHGLYKSFCTGNYLVDKYISSINLPKDSYGDIVKIEKFWLNPVNITAKMSLLNRIRLERILYSLNDSPNWVKTIRSFYDFYSEESDYEYSKRILRSKNGPINFIFKVAAFLIKK